MTFSRPLLFFAAVLILAMLVVLIDPAFFWTPLLLALLAIPALALLALAGFILINAVPQGGDSGPIGWPMLGSWRMLAALALIAAVIFALWPGLDLAIARALYAGDNRFIAQGKLGNAGRFIGYVLPFLVLAAYLLSWLAARLGWPTPFSPKGRDVLFVTLAMILGPGLIVNLGMKDHLHRPRPVQLAEFGGTRDFRPFYRFDGTCPKNCSFPSGEAAEAFWMVAPAALAPAPWRTQAVAGALVFGASVSVLRMAFGGHFLSDVVFAALIMWALLFALRRWIYPAAAR